MADEPRNESQEEQGDVAPQAEEAQTPQVDSEKETEAAQPPAQEITEQELTAASPPPPSTEPAARRGRGCSLFGWIVILAVILAVAAYLVHRAQVEEQRRKHEELVQRRAVRESQISAIGERIAKALESANEGDIRNALMILEAQENLLATIAREASASGDNEDAQRIIQYKGAVHQVAEAIRQKEEELKTFVVQQISTLGSKFPQIQRAMSAIEAQQAQPSEEGEQAASEEGEGQAPETEPAQGGGEQATGPSAGQGAEQATPSDVGP